MLYFIGTISGLNFIVVSFAYILAMLMALSFHEFAHAFAAYKCGDNTPKMQGRVSLNPLRHIDPMGFLCCALFAFGWAKPVQINMNNFRNIKKGNGWTSVAGVLMNLFLSFISYGLLSLVSLITIENILIDLLYQFLYFMFFINLSLAVFNFLPIYPLDGFRFIQNFTKYNNRFVDFMYRYGNIILVVLLICFRGILFNLITFVGYPITWFWNLIFGM